MIPVFKKIRMIITSSYKIVQLDLSMTLDRPLELTETTNQSYMLKQHTSTVSF